MRKSLFLSDYYRMTGTMWQFRVKHLMNFLFMHQIRYMFWWRKAKEKMTPFRRFILYRYSRKYGLEISTSAEIGEGFYIGHPYNITIGSGVEIGNDVMIAPNSFVNFHVPNHSVVVGNPGVIHCKEYATEGYVNFCVESV